MNCANVSHLKAEPVAVWLSGFPALGEHDLIVLMALVLLLVASFATLLWIQRRRHSVEARLLTDIQDEERRLFSFLSGLGHAIEDDLSAHRLNQMIVRGVTKVLGSRGSGIYLLDEEKKLLVPGFVSKRFPALIGLPEEMLEKAREEPKILTSYLSLTRVDMDSGILGKTLKLDEVLWIKDVFADPALAGFDGANDGVVEAMVAPLKHGGNVIGLLASANVEGDAAFTENDFEVFRSISEQTAFALGNAMAHHEAAEKRQLDRELRAASEVQRILLPARSPEFHGYRLEGRNLPARIISGDYFDYIPLQADRMAVVIADVSGKGVPAGLMMAMCRSVLRSVAWESLSPSELLARVNRQLFPDIREDMFISMALLVLDAKSSKVVMARAGHDAPMLFSKRQGTVTELKPKGMAVGIDSGDAFERALQDYAFEMQAGDCLLLYTDGVTEAQDDGGFEFGKAELMESFSHGAADGSLAALDRIESEVRDFAGSQPQTDDITLIGIERR